MTEDTAYPRVAVLGAGVIGASWAALFAGSGREVVVYDPQPKMGEMLRDYVATAAPALTALGAKHAGDMSRIRFVTDPVEAVEGADFVQENAPERLDVKHSLYAQIEPVLKKGALLASSSSGLKLSEMAKGLADPSPLILAHPFNPPHLIPLVELMATPGTRAGALEEAQAFYESLGKVCIRVMREATGHVANRLQAAVWREAIHIALEGIASFEDVDKAMVAGPGLRWSVMGPSTLFHLGGGAGGIEAFLRQFTGPMQSWWDALGAPNLTPETVAQVQAGISEMIAGRDFKALASSRDAAILAQVLLQKPEHFS